MRIERGTYLHPWAATGLLLLAGLWSACSESPAAPEPPAPPPEPPEVAAPRASVAPTVATFTVTTTADAGAGSLRQAILDANGSPGTDLIDFDIPAAIDPGCNAGTGVCTISPLSYLPHITDPIIIDGYTQIGATPNTNDTSLGLNTVLTIEIDGTNVTSPIGNCCLANGLVLKGGNSLVRGLIINRFSHFGVWLDGSNGGNLVEGNFMGTDATGTVTYAVHGHRGIQVYPAENTIGGTSPEARNLISGHAISVEINGAAFPNIGTDNVVEGNLIGTDITGTVALGHSNGIGVGITSGSNNRIGGTTPSSRNVISGSLYSVSLGWAPPSTSNVIQGNYLGTDVTGTILLGGQVSFGAWTTGNILGGTIPGARNVVGGRVSLDQNSTNTVQGNFIGVDATGTASLGLGPFSGGMFINSEGSLIGGTEPGAGNVISAANHGISVGGSDNIIQGNFIGTDLTGTLDLGHVGWGIGFGTSSADNLVGGTEPGAANIIAHNGAMGVSVHGTGNQIIGNEIFDNARTTSANGGVVVQGGSGHSILSNSIHSHLPRALGIDLLPFGPEVDDPGDADSGPNDLQNIPVITSSFAGGGSVLVEGTLHSTPSTTFTLEFFANSTSDPRGFAEGERFVGSSQVTTDPSGNATYQFTFAAVVSVGETMTATATNPAGSTSEFSYSFEVEPDPDSDGPVTSNTTSSPNPVAVGAVVTLTADVDDTSTGSSDISSAEYSLDGGLTWAPMVASDGSFDSVGEAVEASFSAPGAAGIYDLCVRGTDARGNVGDPECIMLVVYDPSAGFVTGGGWIDSPPGAYAPDPMAAGKASFGFVSKYKKGQNTPDGNTQFQFKAGDLNFHSSTYDWLVVNQGGANAQFKGSGTVNGDLAPDGSEYRFMIWAKDGSPDTFRIRIWWEDASGVETDVYDNGFDQALGGGQITIHTN